MLPALWLSPANVNAGTDALLPVQQAFKFSAQWLTAERVRVRWDIADGYYMYRDKIGFDIDNRSGNSIPSTPELPTGIIKQDALFGEVSVFIENFTTELVVPANSTAFDLTATGQGCNEPIGVCYPPMSRTIQFRDPANKTWMVGSTQPLPLQSRVSDAGKVDKVDDLRSLLAAGFQQADFIAVDDAFKLHLQPIQNNEITVVFEIADGYYLYRDRIKFSNDGENRIQRLVLPAGKVKKDPYFGEVTVFNRDFSFAIGLSGDGTDNADNLIIHASYQGCAEDGICYSPVSKSLDVSMLTVMAVAQARPTSTVDALTVDAFKGQTSSESLLPFLLGAFFAGLLLTFTPCVLPMIPILSSIIIGQGNHLTKVKGGILATVYVLGTIVTYAGMGALAGATGDQLQAYFQNVWAIGMLSALFFIMALSMFGLFEIRMPTFIQSRVQARSNNLRGSIPLVFLLGLVSALIIGACVSPILISFLGIAVSRGDPLLGALLMSVMATGMGLPLIAFGLGAGHIIPRVGRWMERIKQSFGIMLIAVAIYLLGSLPQVPILLLWGSFFIILGVFTGAIRTPLKHASNWLRLEKSIGILLLVWGIVLVVGGFLGQRDLFRPLPLNLLSSISGSGISGSDEGTAESTTHPFIRVTNNDELEKQLARARAQNKPLLIDYYAGWCVDCIRMEETTFSDARVKAVLAEKFITVQIDVTDPLDADNRILKQRFGVFGPPATLFIDRDGMPLAQLGFYGYLDSDAFLSLITSNLLDRETQITNGQ